MAISPLGDDENDSGIMSEINITPLTDIFLVLLTMFMITSSAMIESGGKVNLPKAVAIKSETCSITVTLTPKKQIYINQKLVTEEALEQALRETLASSADKIVMLRGDREVLFGDTVKVMSMIKRAGASEIRAGRWALGRVENRRIIR